MKLFHGVYTALVTPFVNGEVDFQSLAKLVRWQLDEGIQGFVVNGTTGESPTLTENEKLKILEVTQAEVSGAVPIVLGTGTNCTATTIAATQKAEKLKVDGVLVVTPYYNKPPQRGLVAHYKAVAEQTSLPILLYNVPGRTAVSLTVETMAELSQVKNIVGVKEASGDLKVLKELTQSCPRDFALVSGDDETYLEFMKSGGVGVISVLSHVIPRKMREQIELATSAELARSIFAPFSKLTKMLFSEANPIPVKSALHMMGIIARDEMRLPLVPLRDDLRGELQLELKNLGIKK